MLLRLRDAVPAALLTLLACAALASPSDQALLPVQADFGCLACHAGPSATASTVPAAQASQLNPFGQDWRSHGRVWSAALAALNSDGDGCSNGFELRDPSGDWKPEDGYISSGSGEARNPGQAGDCLLPLGDQSFGVLKGLFGND